MYQTKEYRSRESIARKQEAGNVTTTEGNPRVYFDIEIGGNAAGRLEFVLFADKVGTMALWYHARQPTHPNVSSTLTTTAQTSTKTMVTLLP